MSLFGKLFGPRKTTVVTTVDRPLRISSPTLGFLNLLGPDAAPLLEADRPTLGPLFRNVFVSEALPAPQCSVLFIYSSLEALAGAKSPRAIMEEARAYIAVFASENTGESYIKYVGKRKGWSANVVMTLNRNGDKFARFYTHLFTLMYEGKTMPMAWVQLSPQGPSPKHEDCPSSIFAAEAGHIIFTREGT